MGDFNRGHFVGISKCASWVPKLLNNIIKTICLVISVSYSHYIFHQFQLVIHNFIFHYKRTKFLQKFFFFVSKLLKICFVPKLYQTFDTQGFKFSVGQNYPHTHTTRSKQPNLKIPKYEIMNPRSPTP